MRVNYSEPVTLLATVVRWLLLASTTGAIVGTGVGLFLLGLLSVSRHTAHPSLRAQRAHQTILTQPGAALITLALGSSAAVKTLPRAGSAVR